MAKIDLSFVHLHSPLFFAKRNWGEKLDIANTSKGKIQMAYDRVEKEVLLKCDNHIAIIPTSNVVSMTPVEEKSEQIIVTTHEAPRAKPGPKPKAQVSGPHDHVFANAPGKTRD